MAGFLVVMGAIFDFFDGFAARLLKVQGELGKQLDSLADMVTFGVAPGVIMYSFIKDLTMAYNMEELLKMDQPLGWFDQLLPYTAFIIPLLSAVRLAKFNIDTRQTDKFIGLPTPAIAMVVISLPLWYFSCAGLLSKDLILHELMIYDEGIGVWGLNRISSDAYFVINTGETTLSEGWLLAFQPIRLAAFSLLCSILLVANLEMIALKFKSFGWKGNEARFIFIALSVVVILLSLLISSVFVSVPIIILLYIIISIINNLINKRTNELQS